MTMKKHIIFLAFLLLYNFALSQQIKTFDLINSGNTKVKFDPSGNPIAINIGLGDIFYLFKSQNGQIKNPEPLFKLPVVYTSNQKYPESGAWDFEVDTAGVIHIAGVIYRGELAPGPTEGTLFYYNTLIDSVLLLGELPTSYLNLITPQVLRTLDNKIVVNFTKAYLDTVIWFQIFDPRTNINVTTDTIKLDGLGTTNYYLYISANKNLYITIYESKHLGGDGDWGGYRDTVAVSYQLLKFTPGGNIQRLRTYGHTFYVDDDFVPTQFPMFMADLNDGFIEWFKALVRISPNSALIHPPYDYNYNFYGSRISSYILDREGNLHIIREIPLAWNIGIYRYQVYTPGNMPINEIGHSPIYDYLIEYDSTTYWTFKQLQISANYVPPYVSDALNLNKAIIQHPQNDRNGVILLYQNSGNFNYEVLLGTGVGGRTFNNGDPIWYVDNDGKVYFSSPRENRFIDSLKTAYIYFYQLKSSGSNFIVNYKLSEIQELPVPYPSEVNKIFGLKYTLDKNQKMHFLFLSRDTIRGLAYLGRLFLASQKAGGGWDTMQVSPDTVEIVQFSSYSDFTVDDSGVVHVLYYTYKNAPLTYYTNNSGGRFKPPVLVDSVSLRNAQIRVAKNGLVYIWGNYYYGTYRYWYGDYNSGFKRSSRTFTDWNIAEVDNSGNLYIVTTDWYNTNDGSRDHYLYKFNRDSALIYYPRKLLIKYFSGSPVTTPYFTFVKDVTGLIHLLATYKGKLYYWNLSDNFTARVEYDYSDLFRFKEIHNAHAKTIAVANDFDRRIYFMSLTSPILIGWIPYGVTSVEDKENILPTEFLLEQNYPNPFNPATTISFELPIRSNVEITIYDILGRKLKTLVDEVKDAGRYKIMVDMSNYASGVYFYRMVAKPVSGGKDYVSVKKMILVK